MAASPFVGRVILEDVNGHCTGTADYRVPVGLRAPLITLDGGQYVQQRQLDDKKWVYRWLAERGARPVDPHFGDFRQLGDPNWDGPVPAPPPATWQDVNTTFQKVLHEALAHDGMVFADRILRLYQLTQAFAEGRPFEGA